MRRAIGRALLLAGLAVFCVGAGAALADSVWLSAEGSGGEMSGDDVRLWSAVGLPTGGALQRSGAGDQLVPGGPIVALKVPEPGLVALQLAVIASVLGLRALRRRGARRGRALALSLSLVGGLLIGMAEAPAQAADTTVRHLGYLTDADGEPVDGARNLGFSLFTTAEGGVAPEWAESHTGVPVEGGLFEVLLGSRVPLTPDLFAGAEPLWLETSLNGAPLRPRVPIHAVAHAAVASGLGGVEPSGFQKRIEACGKGQVIEAVSPAGDVTCVELQKGPPGSQGPQGPQGAPFVPAEGNITNEGLAVEAVETSKLATGAVTLQKLATDFTLDVSHVGGLIEDPTGFFVPSNAANRVTLEIESIVFAGEPVVIEQGPAATTDRILGFHGDGRPMYSPGLTQEQDFVFVYTGTADAALNALHQNYLLGPKGWQLRAMSIIVRDLFGREVFRWNLFEYGLASIEGSRRGGPPYRYTFVPTEPADTSLRFEIAGSDFGNNTMSAGRLESNNVATDKRVEIDGVSTGPYPAVSVDTRNNLITLTYDWVEGCCIHDWYRSTVMGMGSKRVVSIIEEAIPGDRTSETSRRNYFEAFPVEYDNSVGFGQDYKMKARIVLSYDWWEDQS